MDRSGAGHYMIFCHILPQRPSRGICYISAKMKNLKKKSRFFTSRIRDRGGR